MLADETSDAAEETSPVRNMNRTARFVGPRDFCAMSLRKKGHKSQNNAGDVTGGFCLPLTGHEAHIMHSVTVLQMCCFSFAVLSVFQ